MDPFVFVKEIKAHMCSMFRDKSVCSLILTLLRMYCSWNKLIDTYFVCVFVNVSFFD